MVFLKRHCKVCDKRLPATMSPLAKYCSSKHRQMAYRRRKYLKY